MCSKIYLIVPVWFISWQGIVEGDGVSVCVWGGGRGGGGGSGH